MSLKKDYKIFYKYDFYKQLMKLLEASSIEEVKQEHIKETFNRNIKEITDKNSQNIFSSRLVNNAFENERFPLEPYNTEDRDFVKKFIEVNKNAIPSRSYQEEAMMKMTGNLSDLENNIERIFNEVKDISYEDINLPPIDLINCFYYSQLQICRSKATILNLVDDAIRDLKINIKHLTREDALNIRTQVFRKQLDLKSNLNIFDYQNNPQFIKRNKKFWLGDCDTIYFHGDKKRKICDCESCETEEDSDCNWREISDTTFSEALFFHSPHSILYFPNNHKAELNLELINEKWNIVMLHSAIFHIIIDNESIDELYINVLQLLKSGDFYSHQLTMIENLNKVETFLRSIKNSNNNISEKDQNLILSLINSNKENSFLCNFDSSILVDALLKRNNITIYTDCYHPKHQGIYVYKHLYPFGQMYQYKIRKGQ